MKEEYQMREDRKWRKRRKEEGRRGAKEVRRESWEDTPSKFAQQKRKTSMR